MMKNLLLAIAFLAMLAPALPAFSHGGGTNANGCHTNHSTGDYHCHTPKTPAPSQVTYCHVVDGEYRCGYAASTCNRLVATYGGYCTVQ